MKQVILISVLFILYNTLFSKQNWEEMDSRYTTSEKNTQNYQDKDTDNDGIPDYQDFCPRIKGTKAKNGCPEESSISIEMDTHSNKSIQINYEDFSPLKQLDTIWVGALNLYVSKYEITIAEYMEFAHKTKSNYPEWLDETTEYYIKRPTNKTYVDKRIAESMFDIPITGISWTMANEFCRYIGGRLPTVEEWEELAYAGRPTRFSGSDTIEKVGWYYGNASLTPKSVGKLMPNDFGLYDMTGNVWEWCANFVDNHCYCKGGGITNVPWKCQIANWERHTKNTKRFDIGFRVVFDPKKPK